MLRGGTRDGATAAPTVVADPAPDASVVVHEVFGALVAVLPYDDFGAVIDACNTSRYGLQAGLFTRDMGRIFTAWRSLQIGALIVSGSSNYRLDHVPFGGVKDSGFGRETPRWMIDDYTVVKTLMLRGLSMWGDTSLPTQPPWTRRPPVRPPRTGRRRMTVTAAEALAGQLESYGVEYVFGTCGHTNIALLDAWAPARSSS